MKTFLVEWFEFAPCSNSNPELNRRVPPFVNATSRYSGQTPIKATSPEDAVKEFLRPFKGRGKIHISDVLG